MQRLEQYACHKQISHAKLGDRRTYDLQHNQVQALMELGGAKVAHDLIPRQGFSPETVITIQHPLMG